VVSFTLLLLNSPVAIGQEAGLTPEPVWTLFRRRGNLLPLPGIEAHDTIIKKVKLSLLQAVEAHRVARD
jgi:hypothetical protein